jgi:hypothetical protein
MKGDASHGERAEGEARRAEMMASSTRLADLVRRGVISGLPSNPDTRRGVLSEQPTEGPTVVSVEQGKGGLGNLRNGANRRDATVVVFLNGRGRGKGRRGKRGGGRQ